MAKFTLFIAFFALAISFSLADKKSSKKQSDDDDKSVVEAAGRIQGTGTASTTMAMIEDDTTTTDAPMSTAQAFRDTLDESTKKGKKDKKAKKAKASEVASKKTKKVKKGKKEKKGNKKSKKGSDDESSAGLIQTVLTPVKSDSTILMIAAGSLAFLVALTTYFAVSARTAVVRDIEIDIEAVETTPLL
eukprot:m.52378 g.52378  ORF g.52378 m.52378 type:complete len:189 (-) comp10788_c0_seq1:2455-3021(-)